MILSDEAKLIKDVNSNSIFGDTDNITVENILLIKHEISINHDILYSNNFNSI